MRYLLTCLIFLSSVTFAADNQGEEFLELNKASENISTNADRTSITASLYHQMRPLALINDHTLTTTQIDKRVHDSIARKYTPVLISNYALLYSKMRAANQNFSNCDNFNQFALNDNVMMTLCVVPENGNVKVKYMTKGYSKDRSQASVFVFRMAQQARLISIKLGLNKEQKVHIEGI